MHDYETVQQRTDEFRDSCNEIQNEYELRLKDVQLENERMIKEVVHF